MPSRIAVGDRLLGRGAILGDHDALAGREAVGLQHDRQAELADAHDASASSSDSHDAKARGRHAVARHERLRERLARLEPRRGRGRTEQQPAVGREAIGDAEAQRQLGADDGEVDLLALGERERGRRDRSRSTGSGAREPGDSGIAGRGDDLADVALGGQPGDQRVLARAAADNENSH